MRAEAPGRIWEAVLVPHAPVLVPEVGCGRERQAGATVAALRGLAAEIVEHRPEAIVVISPHSPRRPGQFGVWSGRTLAGDLARFGHGETSLTLPNDLMLADSLRASLISRGLQCWEIPAGPMDHGAFVPLYFLDRAGWHGPTVVMGLNLPGEGGWRSAGHALAEVAGLRAGRTVVVASGDMSHRLLPGAPAGYLPRARDFDQEFVRLVGRGDYDGLARLDPVLQEDAAEDVVDSTLIAAHAVGLRSDAHEVLSYEGPFGVGYCVARLFLATEDDDQVRHVPSGECLPAVAREAVRRELSGTVPNGRWRLNDYLNRPAGVFVTIRDRAGELRGCRGTICGREPNVIEETRAVAVSSALHDGRFEPVRADELDDLVFEVSVLHPVEPVASLEDLDPVRYGVVVTTADGRHGLMLPDVAGLDTAARQVAATRRKAHIGPDEPVSLARFTVDKFAEGTG